MATIPMIKICMQLEYASQGERGRDGAPQEKDSGAECTCDK